MIITMLLRRSEVEEIHMTIYDSWFSRTPWGRFHICTDWSPSGSTMPVIPCQTSVHLVSWSDQLHIKIRIYRIWNGYGSIPCPSRAHAQKGVAASISSCSSAFPPRLGQIKSSHVKPHQKPTNLWQICQQISPQLISEPAALLPELIYQLRRWTCQVLAHHPLECLG
jgi:hypothetical protein